MRPSHAMVIVLVNKIALKLYMTSSKYTDDRGLNIEEQSGYTHSQQTDTNIECLQYL
jgi:hypothetical protein